MSANILPFRVYQVLSEHTDADHVLPMGELLRLLRTEYGLHCDRRAVYAASAFPGISRRQCERLLKKLGR